MKRIIDLIGLFLLLLVLSGCASSQVWYTKIDASRGQENQDQGVFDFSGSGNLKYSYTLLCINEKGEEKEITFGSDTTLDDGTILALEVKPFRGVLSWEEIPITDVPYSIRKKL
ncbi:YxeA family protein [Dubosiella newyorkensis]|uniref:YxeA family protein n=1 Tax=Dubosiella newyorkensis TaxID=1862672 RepID=UPI002731F096|nr:YxeA family protein [Dubosiella newyorkensis]